MKNNTKKVTALWMASLLAVTMIASATFAWFTAKHSVDNHLETAQITDDSVQIIENFTPPTDWGPGQTITKDVKVANLSSGDVFARVSFEEILTMLSKPVGLDTSIDDTANKDKVAQYFNVNAYSTWTDARTAYTVEGPGTADTNLKIKVKTETAGGRESHSFAAWYEIQNGVGKGRAQRVSADFKIDDKKLILSNTKYWASDPKTEKAAWADFGADSVTKATPKSPNRNDIKFASTDTGKKILLNYADTSVTLATTTAGKWFYNQTDGFFYYIGKVVPGTTSESLLSSLTLDVTAGNEYAGLSFNLIVNLEAIENIDEALTSSTGWGLSTNSDVYKALKPFVKA
jgi:hypothetical protein